MIISFAGIVAVGTHNSAGRASLFSLLLPIPPLRACIAKEMESTQTCPECQGPMQDENIIPYPPYDRLVGYLEEMNRLTGHPLTGDDQEATHTPKDEEYKENEEMVHHQCFTHLGMIRGWCVCVCEDGEVLFFFLFLFFRLTLSFPRFFSFSHCAL